MAAQKQPLPAAAKTISSRKGHVTRSRFMNTEHDCVPAGSTGSEEQHNGELAAYQAADEGGAAQAPHENRESWAAFYEKFGLSLPLIGKLGLLSKAEQLGVLSAATDPVTPSTLSTLSLTLLNLGPVCVYFVPEDYPWEVVAQVEVSLGSVVGGSAAFAASTLVSNLQKSQ